MLYVYATRFDVMENLEKFLGFWVFELNNPSGTDADKLKWQS
jgi:hypothetical protein